MASYVYVKNPTEPLMYTRMNLIGIKRSKKQSTIVNVLAAAS